MRELRLTERRLAANSDVRAKRPCWMDVRVPTTVQSALVAADRAPSPWLDRNAEWFRSVEDETWIYRTEFAVPEEDRDADAFEVVFEGVSVYAHIWLNGSIIGSIRNAYHEHSFDATPHIHRERVNEIIVECRIPIAEMRGTISKKIGANADDVRPFLRVPQMVFGWDFAPRLPLIGLWRPVSLRAHRAASISDLWVRTLKTEGATAELEIEVSVRSFESDTIPANILVSVYRELNEKPLFELHRPIVGNDCYKERFTLENAQFWYPQPVGEPFRYYVIARLERNGELLDERHDRFGVRTVKILQEDEFTFSVNGRRVFAKGANWVPADSLALDAPEERLRHLLQRARDANFNMLRVWGGGIYESPLFYDLCDEFGIMVWQDFMYACSMYPDNDPAFVESATREAECVVKRLRRHPSIVLWCGNNECQEAWVLGDWPERADRHYGERFYDDILPDVVARVNPEVPYWPGSPFGGPTTRSRTVGDFHDWYSLPNWRTYDENAPRFSSEYGFRSIPERNTLDTAISSEIQWEPHPPQHVVWKYHHGWCGWMNAVLPEFGVAETLDEYIMLTQEVQATLMRYAIEVYRRRMYDTSGSLIWMYNEPWPAATFSVIDYYGRPKAAYYWVRKAYEPVMVMLHEKTMSVWAANDMDTEFAGILRVRRFKYDGTVLGDMKMPVNLRPNGATCLVEHLPNDLRINDSSSEHIHVALTAGRFVSERTYHAGNRRDWTLTDASIDATVNRIDQHTVQVRLMTERYAHFVSVSVDDPLAVYSDNFVDLYPNESREIRIKTEMAGTIRIRTGNAAGAVVQTLSLPESD